MIKTGITSLYDFRNHSLKTWFGGEKKISITLYNKILHEEDADEIAEKILKGFSDERGAYKRTYSKRFQQFDGCVLEFLRKQYSRTETIIAHDCGISDGRTSLDFFQRFVQEFPNVSFFASDYQPRVLVIKKGRTTVTISPSGNILEIMWPPFVFHLIKRDSYRHYPVNHLIRFFIEHFIVPPIYQSYLSGKLKAREILLFAPKVQALEKSDSRFHLLQHDLLLPFQRKNHLIRAMNILNTSYFSEQEFMLILSNIWHGLHEHGFLITGSNADSGSVVHGGIFKKTASGFQTIVESGDGSPIKKMVSEWNLKLKLR